MSGTTILIIAATAMACTLGGTLLLSRVYTLNNIKSKTVGDGQHGSARYGEFADEQGGFKDFVYKTAVPVACGNACRRRNGAKR